MRQHRRLAVEQLEDRLTPSSVPLTAAEQYFLELVNRGRANPAAEAASFGIDLNEGLPPGTISTAPKQPLASVNILEGTIVDHLNDLLAHNLFQHDSSDGTSFSQRLTNAGYNFDAGENLALGTRVGGGDGADVDSLYQALFVDSTVADRGHRTNMLDPEWVESGTGFVTGPFTYGPGQTFSSAMDGQDFGANDGSVHYLTGVVYNDNLVDPNHFYTVGEGLGGVTIVAFNGNGVVASDTTGPAGGYQLPLAPGVYDAAAYGGGLGAAVTYYSVSIGTQNVKIDFHPGDAGQTTPANWGLTASSHVIAVGSDAGGLPLVKIVNAATGQELFHFLAYDAGFRGGVRVQMADMNGDSVPDIIVSPGAGGGPHVQVFNGATFGRLANFFAYVPNFTGGVQIAVGNFDGHPDLVTGPGPGGGPNVRVFDIANGQATQLPGPLGSFFAYDPTFAGGVNVAAGNVDGIPGDELIVGAGAGGGPHVEVFRANGTVLSSFFAYGAGFTGGVYVAAGDLNGDGKAEIVTGAGAGGGPNVKVFNGQTTQELASFFAYAPAFTGGVRVAAFDTNGDGKAELVLGPGPGGGPQLRVLDGVTLAERLSFFAFDPAFIGGIWVG